MMDQILEQIPPRVLMIMLSGALVIAVLASHSYLFKGQLAELVRLRGLKSESETAVTAQQAAVREGELSIVERDVEALQARLYGRGPRPGSSQMVAHIIARLDQISARRSVSLDSVKPGHQSEVLSYTEVPFDVQVQGDYFDLFAWLQDAEVELRPLVVKQFELSPSSGGGSLLHMKLRVVSYRAPETRP